MIINRYEVDLAGKYRVSLIDDNDTIVFKFNHEPTDDEVIEKYQEYMASLPTEEELRQLEIERLQQELENYGVTND